MLKNLNETTSLIILKTLKHRFSEFIVIEINKKAKSYDLSEKQNFNIGRSLALPRPGLA